MLVAALTAPLGGRHQVRISLCRSLLSFVFVAGEVAATRDDVGMNASWPLCGRQPTERSVFTAVLHRSAACLSLLSRCACRDLLIEDLQGMSRVT